MNTFPPTPSPPIHPSPPHHVQDAIAELVSHAPDFFAVHLEHFPATGHIGELLLAVRGARVCRLEGQRWFGDSKIEWTTTETIQCTDNADARRVAQRIWVDHEWSDWSPLTGTVDITNIDITNIDITNASVANAASSDSPERTLIKHTHAQYAHAQEQIDQVGLGHNLVLLYSPAAGGPVINPARLARFVVSRANDVVCLIGPNRLIVSCDDAGLAHLRQCMPVVVRLGDVRDAHTRLAADLVWEMWPEGYHVPRSQILQLTASARAAMSPMARRPSHASTAHSNETSP